MNINASLTLYLFRMVLLIILPLQLPQWLLRAYAAQIIRIAVTNGRQKQPIKAIIIIQRMLNVRFVMRIKLIRFYIAAVICVSMQLNQA